MMVSLDGDRLRRTRLAAGLSQVKLAATVGVASHHVGRWERGDVQPSPETLQQLAYALDVDVESLLRQPISHGPTLVLLREATGLTEHAVAALASVSVTRYRQLERGWLTDDLLVHKIAAVLGYPTHIVQAAVDDDRHRLRDSGPDGE